VRRTVLLVAALTALRVMAPAPADAQFLYLTLDPGRVMLYAQDVSLQQVLERWSLAGGATVVNADKAADIPMNLQITGVSEREALAILLRRVGGYLLIDDPVSPERVARITIISTLPAAPVPTFTGAPPVSSVASNVPASQPAASGTYPVWSPNDDQFTAPVAAPASAASSMNRAAAPVAGRTASVGVAQPGMFVPPPPVPYVGPAESRSNPNRTEDPANLTTAAPGQAPRPSPSQSPN
jgi:hypothetical protein